MPIVLIIKKYMFFFFINERLEPKHIHVEYDNNYAKFWLEPISLAKSKGFKAHELSAIHKMIEENNNTFLEKWDEHFKS